MDSRKRQTSTVTPAPPGDFPLWFNVAMLLSIACTAYDCAGIFRGTGHDQITGMQRKHDRELKDGLGNVSDQMADITGCTILPSTVSAIAPASTITSAETGTMEALSLGLQKLI